MPSEYGLYSSGSIFWELVIGERVWAFMDFEHALNKLQEVGDAKA